MLAFHSCSSLRRCGGHVRVIITNKHVACCSRVFSFTLHTRNTHHNQRQQQQQQQRQQQQQTIHQFNTFAPYSTHSTLAQTRCVSSSSCRYSKDNSSQPDGDAKPSVGLLSKLKSAGLVFKDGGKTLWSDVQLMRKTRKKMKDNETITRQEFIHQYETRNDLKKVFPILGVFWFPVIGYFIPLLALSFPKVLLTRHFWTENQKTKFALEDSARRSKHYQTLFTHMKGVDDLQELHNSISTGRHPLNKDLLLAQELFSRNVSELSIERIPREYLVTLCKCWGISSAWFVPEDWMQWRLKKYMAHLHEDDTMLKKEGVRGVSEDSIAKAVRARGLDDDGLSPIAKLLWLQEWIEISEKIEEKRRNAFLAHCGILKSVNYKQHVTGENPPFVHKPKRPVG